MKWKLFGLIGILLLGLPGFLPALTIEEGIIELRLKHAWEKVKADRPSEALETLSFFPKNSDTAVYFHFISGRALEKLRKYSEAMEHYRSAFFYAPPGELKELTLLERADGYFRIRNYYESKISYGLFLKQFSRSKYIQKANWGMAQSLFRIGVLAEALPYYERAGEGVEVSLGQANLHHRLGNVKEAHEWYLKGMSQNKSIFLGSEEYLFYYGENLQQMGRDQEALQYLTRTFDNPVWKKKADLILGLIALKQRKWEEAQKYFQSARSSPDRKTKQEALFHLAEAQWGAGKKIEAQKLFREYVGETPSGKVNGETLLKLAQLDLEEERLDQFCKWIRAFVQEADPKKETIPELEGLILKLIDKNPQRMILLWNSIGQKLLRLSGESFLVQVADGLKKFGKPFVEIQQWLAKHGSRKIKIQSLMALASYHIAVGNLPAALISIKSLKNLKVPGDEILRLEAGIFYANQDYDATVERLLSIKKIVAQDIPLLEGTILYARNLNQALIVFEKALIRLDGNSDHYIKLADILYEKGKKKGALEYYQKALVKDPLNEWALFRTGSLMTGEEAQKKWAAIKNENSLVGRLAKAGLKEKALECRFMETF
jgi:tetratricopeptide (TPR) repeat protein